MFYESNESMSHESMSQQVGSAVFQKKNKWIMNTKSFFFLIIGNLGQCRTKVDKTTKTGYDKAVAWGTSWEG